MENHPRSHIAHQPEEDIGNYHFNCPADHEGTFLFLRGWVNEDFTANSSPILFVHDWGEDSSVFADCAKILSSKDRSIYAFDMRGHGLSGKSLNSASEFKVQVTDLLQIVNWLRHRHAKQPIKLIAQGLSSVQAIYFQKQYPHLLNSLNAISPALKLKQNEPILRRWLLKLASEALPFLKIPGGIIPSLCLPPYQRQHASIIQTLMGTNTGQSMNAKLMRQYLRKIEGLSTSVGPKYPHKLNLFLPSQCATYDYSHLNDLALDTNKPLSIFKFSREKLHAAYDIKEGETDDFTNSFLKTWDINDTNIQKTA